MKELLRMVQEGRLHEADERQLENLKLALELNQLLESKKESPAVDADVLVDAIKTAVAEQLSNLPTTTVVTGGGATSTDPSRPAMRHVNLGDLTHEKEDLEVHGDMKGDTGKADEDAAAKLEKLRKIRGGSK
jgi:hypothetical protein